MVVLFYYHYDMYLIWLFDFISLILELLSPPPHPPPPPNPDLYTSKSSTRSDRKKDIGMFVIRRCTFAIYTRVISSLFIYPSTPQTFFWLVTLRICRTRGRVCTVN